MKPLTENEKKYYELKARRAKLMRAYQILFGDSTAIIIANEMNSIEQEMKKLKSK